MSSYDEGVAALREMLSLFEAEDHEVAAKAADGFLEQVENPTSILYGLDVGAMARTALALTAIILLMRDGTVDIVDAAHPKDECEDPSTCTSKHEEVDLDKFEHYLAGMDTTIDALTGIALALAEREVGFDPDAVDWSVS